MDSDSSDDRVAQIAAGVPIKEVEEVYAIEKIIAPNVDEESVSTEDSDTGERPPPVLLRTRGPCLVARPVVESALPIAIVGDRICKQTSLISRLTLYALTQRSSDRFVCAGPPHYRFTRSRMTATPSATGATPATAAASATASATSATPSAASAALSAAPAACPAYSGDASPAALLSWLQRLLSACQNRPALFVDMSAGLYISCVDRFPLG